MKKLFSVVALLALVGAVLIGCKPKDDTTPTPPEPTNAPAAPTP